MQPTKSLVELLTVILHFCSILITMQCVSSVTCAAVHIRELVSCSDIVLITCNQVLGKLCGISMLYLSNDGTVETGNVARPCYSC